jgi:hypothetical protein
VGLAKFLPVLDSIGLHKNRQRLVLNQNYASFAGNLKPEDIESRLRRTIEYIFPYQKRLLIAMNTGSPYILRAIRFFGFASVISELVHDVETEQSAGRDQEPLELEAAATAPELRNKERS